jgi:hypothetical protein
MVLERGDVDPPTLVIQLQPVEQLPPQALLTGLVVFLVLLALGENLADDEPDQDVHDHPDPEKGGQQGKRHS